MQLFQKILYSKVVCYCAGNGAAESREGIVKTKTGDIMQDASKYPNISNITARYSLIRDFFLSTSTLYLLTTYILFPKFIM